MPAWQKGQSGNPNGRPPGQNLFKTLCQRDVYKAYELLMEIMENREYNEGARVNAIKFHLETGYGKPTQAIEVSMGEGKSPDMMTTEQLKLAAAGQTEELVLDLIATGKLDEIQRRYQDVPAKEEKEVQDAEDLVTVPEAVTPDGESCERIP